MGIKLEDGSLKLASGAVLPAKYLAHASASFLAAKEQEAFIEACGLPLRPSVRLNTLKINHQQFHQMAEGYGWGLTPIPWCEDGFWLDLENANHQLALGNLAEHIQGLFYIQEASSMLPPIALLGGKLAASPMVADLAAAPGSKTTQIAAALNNRGLILANELSASRLKSLPPNLNRCGVLNTCLSHQDAVNIGDWLPQQFDRVLLDAPCGGEGTIRKDRQALQNWSLDSMLELAQLQKKMILSAYRALKPGGRLVYSTCTLSKEENQEVANYLCANSDCQISSLSNLFAGAEKALTAEGYLLVLPQHFDSEGFFIACFEKPEAGAQAVERKEKYQSPFTPLNKAVSKQVCTYFQSQFGLAIELEGYQLKQRDNEIWLFPRLLEDLSPYLKINRAGLKIAKVFPNKIRVSHEFAVCLGDKATQQKVSISAEDFATYLQGRNIAIESNDLRPGDLLLSYADKVFAVGLNQKGKIKNALPRDLVRDNYQIS